MANITKEDVISFIETMTVLELSELVKELEEKFGVSAMSAMPMAAIPGAGEAGGPAKEEEKQTEFAVILTAAGDKRVQVIKAVREITGLGLRDAKALVDEAPKSVKENIPEEDVKSIKTKLEDAGATVEVK